jgi:hypothetical protein
VVQVPQNGAFCKNYEQGDNMKTAAYLLIATFAALGSNAFAHNCKLTDGKNSVIPWSSNNGYGNYLASYKAGDVTYNFTVISDDGVSFTVRVQADNGMKIVAGPMSLSGHPGVFFGSKPEFEFNPNGQDQINVDCN